MEIINGIEVVSAVTTDGDLTVANGDLTVTTGDIDLVHADGKLLLPQKNDAAHPTVSFGDGDSGLYEQSNDVIAVSINGYIKWIITDNYMGSAGFNKCVLRNALSTNTTPNIVPANDDPNTGIGRAAADALSLIAGGVEGHRITEAAGAITHELTGTVQGDLLNNWMVQKAGFDVLGLMTDPRFLNLLCEDPGAGTMTDVSGQGNDGTYQGLMTTGDRVKKGMGWVIDFDGSDDYVTFGDNVDFEFDDSGAEPFTIATVVEVVASTAIQTIIAKYDSGTTLREWRLIISANEEAIIELYDESADTVPYVKSAVLSAGYHTIVVTYDGSGGNDADDGLNMYIDGTLDNTAKSSTVGYTAMEPSATAMTLGCSLNSGALVLPYKGDIANVLLDGAEWSSFDVYRFHQLMKGIYGL